jgi:mannose-1-phosphate guanylyltransferase
LFQNMLRVADQVARKDYLVTLGITPTFPATGFGYIQQEAPLPEGFEFLVYRVKRFTEKPDEATAIAMLAAGGHSWNSGMFIWRVNRILEEFSRQMPELKRALDRISAAWGTSAQKVTLASEWQKLRSETIDYGIMEHANNVVVLPAAGLEWSDVGSWDSLFDVLQPDADGNVTVKCEHMPIETHNSLIYSSGKKLIVTIGVEDLIVIDSEDALLVCHRDQAQQVRQVIANLKESQREEYL